MNRLARLAAVIAPVLGLAALWGLSERTYYEGTDWEVPIQGYDPRDYLRGHYVEFSYDWPGIDERGWDIIPTMLCLEGEAPKLVRVTADSSADCAHPLREGDAPASGRSVLMDGRLYLDQNRARALDEALRNTDQRGIVTIRQRDDGSFTPISIRFRPLTPEEIAERDAQNAAPFMPPAIMLPESSGNPPPSPQSAP
jgi:GDYXXLXY protein